MFYQSIVNLPLDSLPSCTFWDKILRSEGHNATAVIGPLWFSGMAMTSNNDDQGISSGVQNMHHLFTVHIVSFICCCSNLWLLRLLHLAPRVHCHGARTPSFRSALPAHQSSSSEKKSGFWIITILGNGLMMTWGKTMHICSDFPRGWTGLLAKGEGFQDSASMFRGDLKPRLCSLKIFSFMNSWLRWWISRFPLEFPFPNP